MFCSLQKKAELLLCFVFKQLSIQQLQCKTAPNKFNSFQVSSLASKPWQEIDGKPFTAASNGASAYVCACMHILCAHILKDY